MMITSSESLYVTSFLRKSSTTWYLFFANNFFLFVERCALNLRTRHCSESAAFDLSRFSCEVSSVSSNGCSLRLNPLKSPLSFMRCTKSLTSIARRMMFLFPGSEKARALVFVTSFVSGFAPNFAGASLLSNKDIIDKTFSLDGFFGNLALGLPSGDLLRLLRSGDLLFRLFLLLSLLPLGCKFLLLFFPNLFPLRLFLFECF
mmetsp:Transcript_29516/g.32849  ORF Transcript_29516/g.32849 Transcript_29516/m.32849 type:complete len:203 (-) Transcript_29516:116-724(-)